MSIASEIFNYIISLIRGEEDPLLNYQNTLNMAERYLYWGYETKDIRDFLQSLEYIKQCNDKLVGMPKLIIRKYNCLIESFTAVVNILLDQHKRALDNVRKKEKKIRLDIENLEHVLEASKIRMAKMREEGSLIKVKEEEEVSEDVKLEILRLRDTLVSGESKSEGVDSYDSVIQITGLFFKEINKAVEQLPINEKISKDICEQVIKSLKDRSEKLKELISGLKTEHSSSDSLQS